MVVKWLSHHARNQKLVLNVYEPILEGRNLTLEGRKLMCKAAPVRVGSWS